MEKNDVQKVKGMIGPYVYFNNNVQTNNVSVISIDIKPDKPLATMSADEWLRVKASGPEADHLKSILDDKNLKVRSVTVSGRLIEPDNFINKEGKEATKQVFEVERFDKIQGVGQMHGNIGSVSDKKDSKEKPYTNVYFLNNTVSNGVEVVNKYNIHVYENHKKNIPSDVVLQPGNTVATKGDFAINRYVSKTTSSIETSTQIIPYNIDKTPTLLNKQIKELQDKKSEKAAAIDADQSIKKAPSSKKNKDTEIGM